jgi:poly-gamma-glutamate capsule biosynthesis protein CapA/YwtB (metallophosphatase superfamily)
MRDEPERPPAPGRITLAAVGDCLLGRRVSALQDPGFLDLVELLRTADCAWGNCEVVLADPRTVYRAPKTNDPHAHCEPWGAGELRFLGLNLLGTANNHTMDFGVRGLGSTLTHLDQAGIVHAGAGLDLEAAARPAYLTTPAGQAALVNCAASFLDFYAAGPPHPVFKGRPGLNPLHLQYTIVLERSLFESLGRAQAAIHDLLGWDEYADILRQMEARRPAGTALFFETMIKAGESVDFLSEPRPADVSRIVEAIRSARQSARLVIASIHSHEARRRLEIPDPFLPPFARTCLDAGADICLAAGPHVLRGIEIYHGKPIFYSLGNFCAHFRGPAPSPSTSPRPASPEGTGLLQQRRFWESFVPRITFAENGEVAAIDLHPIALGFDESPAVRGTPRLARGEEARGILTRLAGLSLDYGTRVELDGEIGRVLLEGVGRG